jgi:hypothetical protein
MNRRSKSTEYRNRQIYAEFCVHIRNDTPVMLAYAALGNRYDLSEVQIRAIVAEQAKKR